MAYNTASTSDTLTNDTMAQNQNQNQNQNEPRNREENRMNEYDRRTDEWNQSNNVRERQQQRSQMINNTDGYHTGNRIHHIRSIQMPLNELWEPLFGNETLHPILREYSQASMEWVQDETDSLPFAGQMEVSLLMQENYRPDVHLAVFIVHLYPHRHFQDGHVIQMEIGEGSNTHQTVTRMFDVNARTVVLQATQYQLLEFLADDDEAMELLNGCFMHDFEPVRFSYVALENEDDYGYYIANPFADDEHNWHDCANDVVEPARPPVAVPPPPPVNDFAAVYRENFGVDDAEDADEADDIWAENAPAQNNINEYNYINHYIQIQNQNADVDADLPASG